MRRFSVYMTGIVIIDPQIAGISGDMLLSGLIDLGADKKIVIDAIYSCEDHFKGSKITSVDFIKAKSNGISCINFCLILRKIAKAFLALPCINQLPDTATL